MGAMVASLAVRSCIVVGALVIFAGIGLLTGAVPLDRKRFDPRHFGFLCLFFASFLAWLFSDVQTDLRQAATIGLLVGGGGTFGLWVARWGTPR
jgi:hypothetical protein